MEVPSNTPKAPKEWAVYNTCDFTSHHTGLRIIIYYQGAPCNATVKWVGYRQQYDGEWEENFSKEWGELDLSQFICCTPA